MEQASFSSTLPTMIRPITRPRHSLVLLSIVFAGMVACGDEHIASEGRSRPVFSANSFQCAVSFEMITTYVDSGLVEFQSPTESTDTSSVCENWTGSDYDLQVRTIGSSAPVPETRDTVEIMVSRSGQIAGYAADGGEVVEPREAAASTFELVGADSAQIQASYADPYYAVVQSSDPGGGGGGGDDGGGGECQPGERCQILGSVAPANLRRHGLRRAAMAALMHDKDEIAKEQPGTRRFRRESQGREVIFELDSITELLRAHEIRSATSRVKSTFQWTRMANKWVRSRIDVETVDERDGVHGITRSTTTIYNVHWNPAKVR